MTAVSEKSAAGTPADGAPAAPVSLPRDPVGRLTALFDAGTMTLLPAVAPDGSGAIESVASVKALTDRVAPPTINLDDLDDEVTISVATKSTPLAPHPGADGPMAVLNNAFGFGGHNVALVFTEYVPPAPEGSAEEG